MSFSELFSDSYELNVEENNAVDDDFEFEINEDDVKEMLFDDNYDSTRFLKETSSKSGDNERTFNCQSATPSKESSTESESKRNSTRNLSNLVTLTESECPVKNDLQEDDDDDDEQEERHAKFRSERNKCDIAVTNTRRISTRDIPDSLDKVVLSSEAIERLNERKNKRKDDNRQLKSSEENFNNFQAKCSPNKIHINPHFRANRSNSNSCADISVNTPLSQANTKHSIAPLTSNAPRLCLSDQKPLLPLPVSTSFTGNNQPSISPFVNQNNFPRNVPFTDHLIQNHSMNNQQQFNARTNCNPFTVNGSNPLRVPLISQQQPQFTEANYWQQQMSQNEKSNAIWTNPPVPRPQSTPYLPQTQSSQFPSVFPNSFSYPGHVNQQRFRGPPLCPNPQNAAPHVLHQRPLFQEPPAQNPRYLPQHVFATRFPQQYPPTRPELPNFPRPEPISGLIPAPILPIVERHQAPVLLGTTTCRTLLPSPMLPQQQQPPPPQVPPQMLSPRVSIPRFASSSDFGILQSRDFVANHIDNNKQYRSDQRGEKRNSSFLSSPKKFMKTSNNKLLKAKYSGLKTVCNGAENDSRKVALNKTKMAKRFLQKRPATSVKQIACKAENKQASDARKIESEKVSESVDLVELEVDDDYKKALEKQKQMREEVLRRKEERRRLMAMQKLQEAEAQKTSSQSHSQNSSDSNSLLSQKNSPIKTLVNRAPVRLQNQTLQRERQVIQLKQQGLNCANNTLKKSVKIKGLALSTTESSISKLCKSVGLVKSVHVNYEEGEKTATVVFESPKDASTFQQKYQRHLLDLCVIQVSLV